LGVVRVITVLVKEKAKAKAKAKVAKKVVFAITVKGYRGCRGGVEVLWWLLVVGGFVFLFERD
jgi:hypothetical protein